MTTERCFICDEESLFFSRDIVNIKSKHSETPIISILEEVQEHPIELYTEEDPDASQKIFCQDCLWKIDEYDRCVQTARILKDEFRALMCKVRYVPDMTIEEAEIIDSDHIESGDEKEESLERDTVEEEYIGVKLEDVTADQVVTMVPIKSYILKCKECDIVFNNMKDMKKHKKIHTISEVDEKQEEITIIGSSVRKEDTTVMTDLYCKECSLAFSTKSEFVNHKKLHDCRCPTCDGLYANRELLEAHMVKHDMYKPLQCVECEKQFTKRNNLARHMPIHTGEKLYQCELCGKEYIHHSSFRMHKMAHKNIREKSCATCGLTFRSQSHLNRHIRIHTGAKPYECPICNQKFAQRYNMLSHMKIHTNQGAPAKKPHRCVICNAAYAKQLLLKDHMKRAHCDTLVADNASDKVLSKIEIGEIVEIGPYENVKIEHIEQIIS